MKNIKIFGLGLSVATWDKIGAVTGLISNVNKFGSSIRIWTADDLSALSYIAALLWLVLSHLAIHKAADLQLHKTKYMAIVNHLLDVNTVIALSLSMGSTFGPTLFWF